MSHARRPLIPLAFALTVWSLAISVAQAATLNNTLEYATTGAISHAGITGAAVVQFEGLTDAFAATPTPLMRGEIPVVLPAGATSWLSLGQFDVTEPPTGQTTIYAHTPFAITFLVKSVGGFEPAAAPDILTVKGWLDGTVANGQPSSLVAHYQLAGDFGVPWEPRDEVGSFQSGGLTQTLTIPGVTTILAPRGGSSAVSSVLVSDGPLTLMDPHPTPEPGVLATLLAGLAGLAARARWRRGRAHSGQSR